MHKVYYGNLSPKNKVFLINAIPDNLIFMYPYNALAFYFNFFVDFGKFC